MQEPRYHRQTILPGFGAAGQQKLAQASVLVVGAGGLGCPALQYLVAAGVGYIGVADFDTVSLHNLHRQVLYTEADIGLPKAEVAIKKLKQMNSQVKFECFTDVWRQQDCIDWFSGYDVIVDCTDNFTTRYVLNDACVLLQKPLVFAAVSQFEGQLAVFNAVQPNGSRSANYRHLFAEPPKAGEVRNCAEAGVLGVLPGILGTMQAAEVIKLITGLGKPLINQILTYNGLTQSSYVLQLPRDVAVEGIPQTVSKFLEADYEAACGNILPFINAEIDWDTAIAIPHATWIDVREPQEQPKLTHTTYVNVPMDRLLPYVQNNPANPVIFVCQSGVRSLQAVHLYKQQWPQQSAYSIRGGINAISGARQNIHTP
ncbi:MAG TPA: HesA/MoeB/ThiF family protein [Phnomibacter sp.]|nr:HesA/MoeB/ThiF family protein [Phnomibacter sp.]